MGVASPIRQRRHAWALFGLLVGMGLTATSAQAQCQYDVTIIQAPVCPPPLAEPPATFGTGLNELGQVVGYHRQCDELTLEEAFVWSPGPGLTTLERPAGVITAKASDINDAGQTVGEMEIDGVALVAFIHDGNGFMEIPPFGGTFSQAAGITNQTEVAGTTGDGSPFFKAYLWENDVMTLILPSFGPRSAARDINEDTQIVGWMGLSEEIDGRAFLWQMGGMIDLGPIPGGYASAANAVNNFGKVVGCGWIAAAGEPGFVIHAFLWEDGQMSDLGTLPGYERSQALDINDVGQIVGNCSYPNPNDSRPFIWQNGLMTDLSQLILDGSGIQLLRTVRSINNAGQIVGNAIGPDGHVVAVLLTPSNPCPGDINGDCVVNVLDLIDLLLCFGQPGNPPCGAADVNNDGTVNVLDLIILLLNFGG